ncbi:MULTISPECIES: hypothetical protein [Pseudomonas]|nr:hypothetical protein [Pseudomonas helleri]
MSHYSLDDALLWDQSCRPVGRQARRTGTVKERSAGLARRDSVMVAALFFVVVELLLQFLALAQARAVTIKSHGGMRLGHSLLAMECRKEGGG